MKNSSYFYSSKAGPNVKPAKYWTSEGDSLIVRCELCPWRCRIKDGRFGYCGVRFNSKGSLYTAIYGAVSSKAVDPIEKKPLFHFYPGSRVYSLGTIGCNLRCRHCQNWEIAHARAESFFFELEYMTPERAVKEAVETGSQGIALTYNEPTIWFEYAVDLFKLAKKKGFYTVFVTNGLINQEPLSEIGQYLDAYRVDVKGITGNSYFAISSFRNYEAVLKSAEYAFKNLGLHVEIVTNIIPGVNDSEEELRRIASWIAKSLSRKVPWHVTRFYPYLGFSDRNPTPVEVLERAHDIGSEEGLEFVYIGNVPGHPYEDTTCPGCGSVVVKRRGFFLSKKDTIDGRCIYCDYDLNIIE